MRTASVIVGTVPRVQSPRGGTTKSRGLRQRSACAPRGLQEADQSMAQNDFAAAISRELRGLLGERRYANWFRKSTRLQVTDHELNVFAGSPYLQSWMQRQFRDVLLQAARTVLGNGARVRFEVDAALAVPDEAKNA